MRRHEEMTILAWLYDLCAIVGGGTLGVLTVVAIWFVYTLRQQQREERQQRRTQLMLHPDTFTQADREHGWSSSSSDGDTWTQVQGEWGQVREKWHREINGILDEHAF